MKQRRGANPWEVQKGCPSGDSVTQLGIRSMGPFGEHLYIEISLLGQPAVKDS